MNPIPDPFGTAFRLVRDPGLAEDIAQQAFEQAWRFADSYDVRRGAVRTRLMRIAHNLAVDAVRTRRIVPVDLNEMDWLVVTLAPDPERLALAGEGRAQLCRRLAGLPAEQARAVVMAAVHGITAREIARPVGVGLAEIGRDSKR